ncbi:MAG: hypothetical protein KGI54_17920 [Pseudomonadota bacterium]|nr:hypothetical protein [Pseudomonadota bacterium]
MNEDEIKIYQNHHLENEVNISHRGIIARAYSGTASPRQAIKAMCLECVGEIRADITSCTGYLCPLWKFRPYTKQRGNDVQLSDNATVPVEFES